MNSFAAALRRGFATGGCRTFATIASQQLRCTTTTNIDVHRRYHGASSENTRPTQLIQHSHYGQSLGSYVNYFISAAAASTIIVHRDDDSSVAQCMPPKKKDKSSNSRPELKATKAGGAPSLGGIDPDDESDRAFDCVSICCILFWGVVQVWCAYCQLRCSFGGE